MTKRVDRGLYYIVVETPQGNWGTDIEGLYLENLLPWQLDTSAADCTGRIDAVASGASVATAARGTVDNFIARVRCGRCGHLWHDGVRYRDSTLVRCPGCEARNSVDSSGIIISDQPERQKTVLTTSYDVVIETPEDNPADPEAVMIGMEQALAAARDAADVTPPGHPHRPGRLYQLGCGLEERFKRTGELADLDAAISAFSEAADSTPPGDADLSAHTLAVRRTLSARFEHTGELADLDAVIAASRTALAALPAASPERPGLLSALGLALRDRFERTSHLADLDDAVTAGRDSVSGTSPDHPSYPGYLAILSATLRVRFEHTGELADLDAAITAGRKAVAAAGPGHPNHFVCRSTLGLALQEWSTATGNQADLDEAITLFAEAVAATPPDHPHYPGYQHNLGRALLARFHRTARLADLDGAVTATRTAVTAMPEGPDRAKHVSVFGDALIARFERTGELGDLDEGIAMLREVMADTPPGHSDHALHVAGLGRALLARFSRVGRLGDLGDAIDAIRDAVNTTSAAHPDRPKYLDFLGVALQRRFGRTGHLADIDAAIDAAREAVAGTSPQNIRYAGYASNLGCALHDRFGLIGELRNLDEAIIVFRDAIAATPSDHFDLHGLRTNLGSVLIDRFKRTGEMADLDEAIAAARQAVDGTPSDHPWYLTQVHNLSYALRIRYERTAAEGDLDEALTTARAAVAATPPDHPRRAAHLNNLGVILHHRFERTDNEADLERAIVTLRDAANLESGPFPERITAARLWGYAAERAGRFDSAADGLAAAVRLLPQFAWHGSSRAIREERVAGMSGLASDAAAFAIRAGRPEQAVEVLEAGRSVLWTQILNLRTDLTDLAEREPELADRLAHIRTMLDAQPPAQPVALDPVPGTDPVERLRAEQDRMTEERVRLAGEFDELVSQIRALDGFGHFLQPLSFAELRSAASGGPVAIVNTSRYGCHALLVSGADVRAIELSGLTREKAITQANTLLGIVTRAADSNRSFLDRERDRHTVLDTLAWLWDTVAEPVLTELGCTGPPAPGSAPPRVWWCPTGRLALLPLHAAGHYPRHQSGGSPGTDTVPDRVISSYTPTLSALLRARGAPAPAGKPALLAVGMPTTPGAGDLPAVPNELDRIGARYPIATRLQSPAVGADHRPEPDPGNQPTTFRVLKELPRHAWAHFSCHGSQHFSDPAESAFWLTDGPLRIADLIQQDTGPRELAFLSACQTSTGSLKAVDEAIHLASAMQLLGYRHVIATLWSIYDSPAPDIADAVYAALAATGAPGAAHALHQGVMALRALRPTDPLAWAPYLHIGP